MIDEEEYSDIAAENERLRAIITRLETKISDDRKVFSLNLALIEKQAFRIAALEAAQRRLLNAIDAGILENPEEYSEAIRAARAALEGKDD